MADKDYDYMRCPLCSDDWLVPVDPDECIKFVKQQAQKLLDEAESYRNAGLGW